MTEAIILFGSKCEVPEDGWREKQEVYEIEIPTQVDKLRAHYLLTTRTNDDIQALIKKIMALTGMDEKAIAEREASFRNPLRGGPEEARDMVDARANQESAGGTFAG